MSELFQLKDQSKFLIDPSKYKIESHINEGSYGCVYKVYMKDNANDNKIKYYAAKVLKSMKETELKAVYREIQILMKFQHPTIIKFYGYSLKSFHNNNITIFMDFAEEGSLSDFLEKYRNNLSELKYDNTARQIILIGIARGMMHLHQHNSIHRDLKPQNILLDSNLYPHISDFGLSKEFESGDSCKQSTSDSTLLYMAPEKIASTNYNRKADVYSFAIIMYEVVTGLEPFDKKMKKRGFLGFGEQISSGYRPQFTDKMHINKSIQNLIKQCWDKDPDKRPTFEAIYKKLAYNLEDSCDKRHIKEIFKNNLKLNDAFKISDNFNNNLNDSSINSLNESIDSSLNESTDSVNDDLDDDHDYYLDGVDFDRVFKYLRLIDENLYTNMHLKMLNDRVKAQKDENEEMKKTISSLEKQIEEKKDDENELKFQKMFTEFTQSMMNEINQMKAKHEEEKQQMQSKIQSLEHQISELQSKGINASSTTQSQTPTGGAQTTGGKQETGGTQATGGKQETEQTIDRKPSFLIDEPKGKQKQTISVSSSDIPIQVRPRSGSTKVSSFPPKLRNSQPSIQKYNQSEANQQILQTTIGEFNKMPGKKQEYSIRFIYRQSTENERKNMENARLIIIFANICNASKNKEKSDTSSTRDISSNNTPFIQIISDDNDKKIIELLKESNASLNFKVLPEASDLLFSFYTEKKELINDSNYK